MSIDSTDFIDNILDEQARRNAAFVDQGDINNLIIDFQQIGTPVEQIGASETITTSVTHPPHNWDDGQSAYGFFTWA